MSLPEDPRRVPRVLDMVNCLLLVCAVLTLNRGVLRLWWIYDDVFVLRYVAKHTGLDYYTSAQTWAEFPSKMFTPIQLTSAEIDLSLFGPEPRYFYLHQLFSLGIAIAALYILARCWLSPSLALAGSLLVLLGAPFRSIAQLLIARHYIEGLFFWAVSVLLFVWSVRQKKKWIATASGFAYIVAALNKEIYVPLFVLNLFLPERDLKTRLRHSVPHAVAVVVYLGWRYAMIGTLAGGYGWDVTLRGYVELIAYFPAKLFRVFLDTPVFSAWIFVGSILIGAFCCIFLDRRAPGLFVASIFLSVLPVIPVSTVLEPRYGMLAWLICVAAFTFSIRAYSRRQPTLALALIVFTSVAGLFAHFEQNHRGMRRLERMSSEGKFFLQLRANDVLRHPINPPSTMLELKTFKEHFLKLPQGASWFYDDIYLCEERWVTKRFWQYADGLGRFVEITGSIPAVQQEQCNRIQSEAPLMVNLQYVAARQALRWYLGPYTEGRYGFVIGNGLQYFEMPKKGGFRVGGLPGISLRVKYEAPKGWLTYSPEIAMDFTKQTSLRWTR